MTLKFDRTLTEETAARPSDAATILFLRDGENAMEVFCVERAKGSRFLGGAIVFPGGRVDDEDRSDAWTDELAQGGDYGALEPSRGLARALGIAACREALEEARLLPTTPNLLDDETLERLRRASIADLRTHLLSQRLAVDLDALVPFGRWITPVQETRRFDARFFLAEAPRGQAGAHDNSETTRSFWASAETLLARFQRGDIELAPPTHRIVEILASFKSVEDARNAPKCVDIICPELRPHVDALGETLALVLPGDPEHSIDEPRLPGRSRYVLRDGRWLPEDAPR